MSEYEKREQAERIQAEYRIQCSSLSSRAGREVKREICRIQICRTTFLFQDWEKESQIKETLVVEELISHNRSLFQLCAPFVEYGLSSKMRQTPSFCMHIN